MRESEVSRGFSVLLVEDNVGDYLLMKEVRNGFRFKVDYHLVTDGLECLNFLRRKGEYGGAPTPDLIILDLSLEKMDGLDTLKEIKKDDNLKSIPVMIFTGSNSPAEIERAYQAGANCYVTKPMGLSQLENALRLMEEFWFGLVKLPGNKL
jgi:two-component system, chemotaxis family, response regulator Rcp1